jgi:hypothetical protein
MRGNLLCGLALAVLAGALALVSGPLSLQFTWPLLLGAAVALVSTRHLAGRVGAFVIGLAATWVGFALRAAVLPDIPAGRALAAAVPVLLVTVAAAASAGRLPLWAGLAGMAAYAGGYDAMFRASPSDFATQSVVAMTSVLLASAIGLLAGAALAPATRRHEHPVLVLDEDTRPHDDRPLTASGQEI